jgi:HK97 family phage portal protein
MSIFDDIKKLFTKNIRTKQAPVTVYNNVGYSTPKRDSFIQYAEEGYEENAVVYKCVNEIATGAASVQFNVFDEEIKLDNHPLINLLERPNPLQAGNEFFQSLYSYLLLSGNSYVLRTGPENQPPKELHLLRPDRIKIEPSNTTIPKSYQYELSGEVVAKYPVDSETGASEIKHFKMWNPTDDYYGLSPIRAASVDIDQHNYAAKHNVNLLMNGARPSGAIVFRPRDEAGMNVQLTESQRQQLISDLELRFQGTNNSGRAMLLEGDFDWKEMGLSPKDMDFLQLKNMSARDIAMCFGVPSQLVGIPDAQTYSNVQEARLSLYEETIIPLIRRVESDLNEYLAPYYGERLRIEYDIDSIPAMAERRRKIYENVTIAVREGIISRNEARDRLGLEPITGGDEVYINANLFPLGEPEESSLDDKEPNPSKEGYDAYGFKSEIRKDVFTTEEEAEERAKEIGCDGIHSHDTDDGTVYMPCSSHADYERITGEELKYHTADPEYLVQQDPRMGEGEDVFDSVGEARERAEQLGCDGTHTLKTPDGNVYMPCSSHSIYMRVTGQDKSIEDIDLTPTAGMAEEARKGLEWRKEFKRGGTAVGVARANQLVRKEKLSPRTVLRMYSFFARHEVDKQAEGFSAGEKGYPSAGRIAWALWGGDAGQSWSAKKRDQIKKEVEKACCYDCEEKAEVSGKAKKTLEGKVKEHNDKHGSKKGKRVTLRMLSAVFRRGVGAYRTNPESVRRNVTGPDQWAIARVNAFLYAVRTGRFRSGQFDRDLLPKDHPLYKPKGKED